jgi:hypothetical protein
MATRDHRSLRVIAFNANGIGRQRYELSKQLQDLHIGVALLSETHLNPHERFFIPVITLIGLAASREEKTFPITM